MRFMLMMNGTHANFQRFGQMPVEDVKAHIRFMKEFNEELKKTGQLVAAEGLDISPTGTRIVRATRRGRPSVTDGPFPETKEFLAGYWIVQVNNIDEAIDIAARASAAPGPHGQALDIPIEVRQVMDAPSIDA